jgi:hypothetical protein
MTTAKFSNRARLNARRSTSDSCRVGLQKQLLSVRSVTRARAFGIAADFNLIVANLSVGIQVPLRKAERRDRIGARRGLVAPRATSSRNAGRDHLGMVGDIERNQRPYAILTLFFVTEVQEP